MLRSILLVGLDERVHYAIHAMPPLGAHGGNTALRDAALLGGNLVDAHDHGGSVESAIAAYRTEMPSYAFKAVDTAAGMMRRLTGSGRFQRMVTRATSAHESDATPR